MRKHECLAAALLPLLLAACADPSQLTKANASTASAPALSLTPPTPEILSLPETADLLPPEGSIQPADPSLRLGETIDLDLVDATGVPFGDPTEWSATGGTINANGEYTAPCTPGTYTVTAAKEWWVPPREWRTTVTVRHHGFHNIDVVPSAPTLRRGEAIRFSVVHFRGKPVPEPDQWLAAAGTINSQGEHTAPSVDGFYLVRAFYEDHVNRNLFAEPNCVTVFGAPREPRGALLEHARAFLRDKLESTMRITIVNYEIREALNAMHRGHDVEAALHVWGLAVRMEQEKWLSESDAVHVIAMLRREVVKLDLRVIRSSHSTATLFAKVLTRATSDLRDVIAHPELFQRLTEVLYELRSAVARRDQVKALDRFRELHSLASTSPALRENPGMFGFKEPEIPRTYYMYFTEIAHITTLGPW